MEVSFSPQASRLQLYFTLFIVSSTVYFFNLLTNSQVIETVSSTSTLTICRYHCEHEKGVLCQPLEASLLWYFCLGERSLGSGEENLW